MSQSVPQFVYTDLFEEDAETGRSQISLLYVDDNSSMLELFKNLLEKEEHICVRTCCSPNTAFQTIIDQKPDLIISDYCMPAMNGAELLFNIRDAGINTPFILFTSHARDEIDNTVFGKSAVHYVHKWGAINSLVLQLLKIIRVSIPASTLSLTA